MNCMTKKAKGGMIKEGAEKYASKAMMKKHEKAETPAKEKMENKKMRGMGMARGGKACKMC